MVQSLNDTQYYNTLPIMLSVTFYLLFAECHYAECHNAECH
jgi:hypothetical protein